MQRGWQGLDPVRKCHLSPELVAFALVSAYSKPKIEKKPG